MRQKVSILVVLMMLPFFSWSQHKNLRVKGGYWRSQRKEIIFGIGAANVLGDLGGLNRVGTDYSPLDLEFALTRPALHFGYRYRFSRYWSTKSILQYGLLRGNDALTSEVARNNRNLNVRTHLLEISQHLEFFIFRHEQSGRFFKTRGIGGLGRNSNFVIYAFSGISGFLYAPQGSRNGTWTNLRPLNTEGQGLPDAPSKYGLFSYGIPMGFGYKVSLDAAWRISLELSYTKTFTDYLDDVSGDYYDNAAIENAYGAEAAYFADPSEGGGEFATWTNPGEMRGDPEQKDGYVFFNISVVRNVTYRHAPKLRFKGRVRF